MTRKLNDLTKFTVETNGWRSPEMEFKAAARYASAVIKRAKKEERLHALRLTVWHGTMEVMGFDGKNVWRTGDLGLQQELAGEHSYILTAMSSSVEGD